MKRAMCAAIVGVMMTFAAGCEGWSGQVRIGSDPIDHDTAIEPSEPPPPREPSDSPSPERGGRGAGANAS